MQHSFDITVAQEYGVNVAIFLNNIAFWIKKNQANNKHFYEGRYWTYNSQEALTELFPYWSRQTIRTVLKSCESKGLLMKGNYNETTYDRTTWYTLTDLGLSLFSCFNNIQKTLGGNQPMDVLKPTSPLVETNQPIPDSKPDIKPDKRKERGEKRPRAQNVSLQFLPNDHHELLAAQLHLDLRKEKECFIDYYAANGRKMFSWDSAFNNWLRKSDQFSRNKTKKEHPVTSVIRELKESVRHSPEFLSLLN